MHKSTILFLLTILLILGVLSLNSIIENSKNLSLKSASYSPGRAQNLEPEIKLSTPALEPVSFSIPALKLSSITIESVGLDDESKMDIPEDDNNVAWYNLGVKPGEPGNAVIAGHYDKQSGDPAVFYNIGKLKPGDELIVTDESGKNLTFLVKGIRSYKLEDFPLTEVFGLHDQPRLNLITCEGEYDDSSKLYSHRFVVYSELKNI